jgi:UrcA family protein
MSRTVSVVCAALLLASAAVPAAYAQRPDANRTTIHTGDLDLYTAKGSGEALDRIEDAAAYVCDPNRGPMLTSERETVDQCRGETTLHTVDRVNHPGLSAQYEGRFPEVIITEGDADPYAEPYYDPYYAPPVK